MAYLANFIADEWVLNTAGRSPCQTFFTPDKCARRLRFEGGNIILGAVEWCERKNTERKCKCATSNSDWWDQVADSLRKQSDHYSNMFCILRLLGFLPV